MSIQRCVTDKAEVMSVMELLVVMDKCQVHGLCIHSACVGTNVKEVGIAWLILSERYTVDTMQRQSKFRSAIKTSFALHSPWS